MNYAGKDYGIYKKTSLYKPYSKFQKPFFKLANISNQAIEYEAQMGNTSGLLISHKKFIRKRSKFVAHDEKNECQEGDVVKIGATRPMSKRKNWRLIEILEKSK